jgi:hypothetical protein
MSHCNSVVWCKFLLCIFLLPALRIFVAIYTFGCLSHHCHSGIHAVHVGANCTSLDTLLSSHSNEVWFHVHEAQGKTQCTIPVREK